MDPNDDPLTPIPDREADTKTLATVYEDDRDIDPAENGVRRMMSKTRTMEEADFKREFEERDALAAQQEPRRHNIVFVVFFLILFVVALVYDGVRRGTMPSSLGVCGYFSSQKRGEGEAGPRKDLVSDCLNSSLWDENGEPITSKERRWEAAYTNSSVGIGASISEDSFSTMGSATLPVPSSVVQNLGNATCTTDGQSLCNGPQAFGICAHGIVIWQPVANGTECEGGEVVAIPINALTGTAPIRPTGGSISPSPGGIATGPKSFGTDHGATARGPPSTLMTITTSIPNSNTNVYGNKTGPALSPLVANKKGWNMKCHAEDNRKIGDVQPCFCFVGGTPTASEQLPKAIDQACKYFDDQSLGPAKPGWKQVLASNYLYKDPKAKNDGGRLLLKMEYWGEVNGNDIDQKNPNQPDGQCGAQSIHAIGGL